MCGTALMFGLLTYVPLSCRWLSRLDVWYAH